LACAALVLMGPATTFGQSGRGHHQRSVTDQAAPSFQRKIVITNLDTGQTPRGCLRGQRNLSYPLRVDRIKGVIAAVMGSRPKTRTVFVKRTDEKATVDFFPDGR